MKFHKEYKNGIKDQVKDVKESKKGFKESVKFLVKINYELKKLKRR